MATKTWDRSKTPDSKTVKKIIGTAFENGFVEADTTFKEMLREFGVKVQGLSFETQQGYRQDFRELLMSNEEFKWNHIDDAIGIIMQWSRSFEAAINESLSMEYQSRLAALNQKYQVDWSPAIDKSSDQTAVQR